MNKNQINQIKFMYPPIVSSMIDAAQKSVDNLKSAITNVKPAGISDDEKYILISFEIIPNDGLKFHTAGKYIGELRGRNRDLCVGFGEEGDKAIAARVLIDGHARKI